MRFENGKSYGEIAKKAGLPSNTMKSWSRRRRLSNHDISEIEAQKERGEFENSFAGVLGWRQ